MDNKELEMEDLPIIDLLLDEDIVNITLLDENKNEVKFYNDGILVELYVGEQRRLYTILEPIDKVDGVEQGEALVFRVYTLEQDGKDDIEIENDFDIVEKVFKKYNNMLENE